MSPKVENWLKRYSFLLSIAGFLLSTYMWYLKVEVVQFKCFISSCSSVLASQYSMIYDVPVPTYGFFYYAFLMLLSFQILMEEKFNKLNGQLFWIFLVIGDLFTIYLRYLEITKIHEWCELCWTSVLILTIINILWGILWLQKRNNNLSDKIRS